MDDQFVSVSGKDTISAVELRRLLHELKSAASPIHIRFRLLGQMWHPHFCKIFLVTENGLVLIDQVRHKTEIIPNLNDIVQVELETRYQIYQPHHHYTVQPS